VLSSNYRGLTFGESGRAARVSLLQGLLLLLPPNSAVIGSIFQ
jgi:hypothetical protein